MQPKMYLLRSKQVTLYGFYINRAGTLKFSNKEWHKKRRTGYTISSRQTRKQTCKKLKHYCSYEWFPVQGDGSQRTIYIDQYSLPGRLQLRPVRQTNYEEHYFIKTSPPSKRLWDGASAWPDSITPELITIRISCGFHLRTYTFILWW